MNVEEVLQQAVLKGVRLHFPTMKEALAWRLRAYRARTTADRIARELGMEHGDFHNLTFSLKEEEEGATLTIRLQRFKLELLENEKDS